MGLARRIQGASGGKVEAIAMQGHPVAVANLIGAGAAAALSDCKLAPGAQEPVQGFSRPDSFVRHWQV